MRESAQVDGSVRALLSVAARALGGETARLEAEVLLATVLACSRGWLYGHAEVTVDAVARARFDAFIARRRAGEPVAYLRGRQEFWSLDLRVSPATLIPRPETELLVELALQRVARESLDVLDLGTGSGAIAVALGRERPAWRVLGLDIDADALGVARVNAVGVGVPNVRFETGDWYATLGGQRFAAIVSNPPYVRADDPCLTALRFEPRRALAAGDDGLVALRAVIGGAPQHLLGNGWLLCEHGADQGAAVRHLFSSAGFEEIETCRDLASRERVTLGRIGMARE
jgi:release factor glutamine methyltransferase